MEDLEIAKKAIKRDEQAFLQLMQEHKAALYRTAYAFLKNEHEAVEAMQEVTFRAYQKIHTVKEPKYIKTWLVRIMINYCQTQLKKSKRFLPGDALLKLGYDENSSYLEIEEAISSLPEKEQQLIYMKYYQESKITEIAVLENIPEGTVKSRLHKALKSLRIFLTEKGGTDHV